MADVERLSVATIREALKSLSDELAATGDSAHLVLGGGAALALAYNARDTTKDVDAFVAETREGRDAVAVRIAAKRVAEARGLPENWLNDGLKGYLRDGTLGDEVFRSDSLVVSALSTVVLLGMKLSAARDAVDFADARVLLARLSGTKEEIWASVEKLLYPGRELTACYVFEDLWDVIHGSP